MGPTAIRLVIFLVIGIVLSIVAFRLVRSIFKSFRPRKKKIQNDVKEMREEIAPYVSELVPLNTEELELLSYNQVNQVVKKGVITTGKGVFTNVYQEPLIAYNYKEYVGAKTALIYARTSEHEYTYKREKGKVDIAIDKQYFGTIKNGKFYEGKEGRAVGSLQAGGNPLSLPLSVNDKEVAAFQDPEATSSPNPRVFKYFNKDLQGEVQQAFLSMTILEMVDHAVA